MQARTREVAQVVLEAPRAQRHQHGVLVDDGVAREVEQHRARLHRREPRLVDEVARRRHERHVQRDEIGVLEHLLDRVRLAHAGGQPPGGVDRDLGIEADHLHAELDRGVGDEAADRPEADHAERAMRQLDAGELLLAVLAPSTRDRRRRGRARRRSRAPGPRCARRAAARSSTSSFTALALAPGALNTGTPRCDISATGMLLVPAPARPMALTLRGIVHAMHVVRAHEDRVGLVDALADGVAFVRKAVQAVATRSG